ncbi:adapter protein complex 3 subunit beta 2 [Plasmodium falciparum RAJ116]|uniref:Adapter protein complex 3 subunit beta 2 n=1 Tax=Plasmodium falciparum RAJ116 TaxID=580058 RepID=A0A0L0CU78_PLAFA|nr:adapter protein complex 3 subunit beta 2 [Plasmodium falciparum RAJ116]
MDSLKFNIKVPLLEKAASNMKDIISHIKLNDGIYFDKNKYDENDIIMNLECTNIYKKIETMKHILIAHILKIDVSNLFFDVLKNISINNLTLKKLIYNYLILYAEGNEELTILTINSFKNDLNNNNYQIRASALKAMASIKSIDMINILMNSLKKLSKDKSPYVRKSCADVIPSIYNIDKDQFMFLRKILLDLINDQDVVVLSSAIMSFNSLCIYNNTHRNNNYDNNNNINNCDFTLQDFNNFKPNIYKYVNSNDFNYLDKNNSDSYDFLYFSSYEHFCKINCIENERCKMIEQKDGMLEVKEPERQKEETDDNNIGRGDNNNGCDDNNIGCDDNNIGRGDNNIGRGDNNNGCDDNNIGRGDNNIGRGDNNIGRGDNNIGRGDNNNGCDDNNIGRGYNNIECDVNNNNLGNNNNNNVRVSDIHINENNIDKKKNEDAPNIFMKHNFLEHPKECSNYKENNEMYNSLLCLHPYYYKLCSYLLIIHPYHQTYLIDLLLRYCKMFYKDPLSNKKINLKKKTKKENKLICFNRSFINNESCYLYNIDEDDFSSYEVDIEIFIDKLLLLLSSNSCSVVLMCISSLYHLTKFFYKEYIIDSIINTLFRCTMEKNEDMYEIFLKSVKHIIIYLKDDFVKYISFFYIKPQDTNIIKSIKIDLLYILKNDYNKIIILDEFLYILYIPGNTEDIIKKLFSYITSIALTNSLCLSKAMQHIIIMLNSNIKLYSYQSILSLRKLLKQSHKNQIVKILFFLCKILLSIHLEEVKISILWTLTKYQKYIDPLLLYDISRILLKSFHTSTKVIKIHIIHLFSKYGYINMLL